MESRSRSSRSGAILQYLGRKFGKFYPADERARVEVDQWLFWQMDGLGPMAGQAHHFRPISPPEKLPYAIKRYTRRGEPALRRDEQAAGGPGNFWPGDYSIADMASIGWTRSYKNQGQNLDNFPQPRALVRHHPRAARRRTRDRGRTRTTHQPSAGRQGSAEGAVRAAGAGVGEEGTPTFPAAPTAWASFATGRSGRRVHSRSSCRVLPEIEALRACRSCRWLDR